MAKKDRFFNPRKMPQGKKCGCASKGCYFCDGCKTTSSKCPNRNKTRDTRHIEKSELQKAIKMKKRNDLRLYARWNLMRAIASRKEWKPKSEMSEQMANYIMVRAEEYLGLLEARISEFADWFDGLHFK